MPDDLRAAVPLLLDGRAATWTVTDLQRVRRLLVDEYAGPDRTDALAAVDSLLAAR